MKRINKWGALCLTGGLAMASAALGQDAPAAQDKQTPQDQTMQQTTQVTDDGVTQTTKTTTVVGKVVRYEPGKTIVVLGPDSKETTYTLSTNVTAPADVQVGREVTLSTEPSASGPVTVSRIMTRSVTSDGKIKTETQTRSTDVNGNQSSVMSTDVTGTVSAIEPGKSVTIVLPDKKTVVYTLNTSSEIPSDVAVGKTYTVQTTRTTANGPLVVKKIVSTTTVKKTTVQ